MKWTVVWTDDAENELAAIWLQATDANQGRMTMSTITADTAMQSVLSQVKDVTEIRDTNGNLLGIYTPKQKTDDEIKKLFDLDRARATLERERHSARPFEDMVAKIKKRAEEKQ